jgi:hypothetical protein
MGADSNRRTTGYGDKTISFTAMKIWSRRFKDGRRSLEDDSRSNRPPQRNKENLIR